MEGADETGPVDLQPLDDFLLSGRAPPGSMVLSDLDGFLTAVAIGPELIRPSEWLPVVWGGEDPVFESRDEAQEVIGLIMARYNEILREIRADPPVCAPIIYKSREGDPVITDWAAGFADGMSLRREAWRPILEDKEAASFVLPILVAGSDEDLMREVGLTEEEEDAFLTEVAGVLPLYVIAIDLYWSALATGRRKLAPLRQDTKIGRNAPCPCGSGRKFKRCCGAA